MKNFRLTLVLILLTMNYSIAQDEDAFLEHEKVPAYSGDEASKYEEQRMEEQEKAEEAQTDSFGLDKYNENVDPDSLKVDENLFPIEETDY